MNQIAIRNSLTMLTTSYRFPDLRLFAPDP